MYIRKVSFLRCLHWFEMKIYQAFVHVDCDYETPQSYHRVKVFYVPEDYMERVFDPDELKTLEIKGYRQIYDFISSEDYEEHESFMDKIEEKLSSSSDIVQHIFNQGDFSCVVAPSGGVLSKVHIRLFDPNITD